MSSGAAHGPPRFTTHGRRLVAAVCAAALVGLVGAEASAQSSDPPSLVAYTASLGQRSFAAVSVDFGEGAASRVDVEVPRDYGVRLTPPAGRGVGYVTVLLADGRSSSGQFASGELVVEDPASPSSGSAACAPGSHAARWRADLTLVGRSPLPLVVYVDTPGPQVDAAAVLHVCPIWESSADAPAVFARYVSVIFEDVLTEPTVPVVTTWRAFVEPARLAGASYTPDPAHRFELRSLVAHPHTITLTARYEPKKHSVLLTGRVMAAGNPEQQVVVGLAAWADDGSDDFATFGPVTTNESGAFTVRRRITGSTTYTASVEPLLRSCQAPSAAAAGCLSETISPPDQASASVHIRGVREAKLVPRARDQALARRASLLAEDFPAGWQGVVTRDPFFPCGDFQPDLSKLTVHGESSSLVFYALDESGLAWSSTEVYSSVEGARAAFARTAKIDAARCIADGSGSGSGTASVGTLRLPRVADASRAFRITVVDPEGTGYGDIVYVRRGRVLIRLSVISFDPTTALQLRLARAVAARAH